MWTERRAPCPPRWTDLKELSGRVYRMAKGFVKQQHDVYQKVLG